jgi:hypothetical protein
MRQPCEAPGDPIVYSVEPHMKVDRADAGVSLVCFVYFVKRYVRRPCLRGWPGMAPKRCVKRG